MLKFLFRTYSKSRRYHNLPEVEVVFNLLKKDGKNTVENVMKWLKDGKNLAKVKLTDEQAKKLFDGVGKAKLDLEKFREGLRRLAKESRTPESEIHDKLVNNSNYFFRNLKDKLSEYKKRLKQKRDDG